MLNYTKKGGSKEIRKDGNLSYRGKQQSEITLKLFSMGQDQKVAWK